MGFAIAIATELLLEKTASHMPLEPLHETELEMIRTWRNAPAVRQAMYTHHEITPEEHQVWYQRLQQLPSARWYLYRDAADSPQGVVYFTALDTVQGTAFEGFYARPGATPGTGTHILFEGLNLAFGELALYKLNGEVLASNDASLNLHKKLGFTQEGIFREQHFDGKRRIDVIRMGILAWEWRQHRERLREQVTRLPPKNSLELSCE